MHELILGFTTVTCDECDRSRFAEEEPCDCDNDGLTTDPHVQRRRQLLCAASVADVDISDFRSVLEELPPGERMEYQDLLASLIAAAASLANEEEEEASFLIAEVLAEVRDRQYEIAHATVLRPWRAAWRAFAQILACFEVVLSEYLLAATASTGFEIEPHEKGAQAAIDAAAALLAELNALEDRWFNLTEGTPADPIETLPDVVAATYRAKGAASVIDFDTMGSELFERITGSRECPPGIGSALSTTHFVATMLMDPDVLLRKARTTYELCRRWPEALAAMAANERWTNQYVQALQELRYVVTEVASVFASTSDSRHYPRSLIRLGAKLVEPISRPFMAAVLSAGYGRDVDALTAKDPNVAINQLKDKDKGWLIEGLLIGLRDADAHNEHRVEEHLIHLTGKRAERRSMAPMELLDTVLAALESIHGLYFGLLCAFSSSDIQLDHLDVEAWGFTNEQRLRLALAVQGWSGVVIEEDDRSMTVTGQGDFPANRLPLVAACLDAVHDSVRDMTLMSHSESGEHVLSGPLKPLRQFQQLDGEFERGVKTIECMRRWSFDGQPIATRDMVRKVVAVKAGEAISEPNSTVSVERLALLSHVAKRLNDPKLAASIQAAKAVMGARRAGVPASRRDIRGINLLAEWEKRKLDPQREG